MLPVNKSIEKQIWEILGFIKIKDSSVWDSLAPSNKHIPGKWGGGRILSASFHRLDCLRPQNCLPLITGIAFFEMYIRKHCDIIGGVQEQM